MTASTTDKLLKTGASTVTTLSAPGKALSATSITVGATTNYPTDTGFVFAIRQVDSDGELVAGTYTEWLGTVSSGTTIAMNAAPVYGSDQVYPAGSTTQVFIPLSSYAHNRLIDGLLVEHDQDGTHGAITGTSLAATGAITSATVATTGKITAGSSLEMTAGTLTLPSASINQSALPLGAVVQVVNTVSTAVATGTTQIPFDDTIPQITEGDEYMTLAITPKATTNVLVIEALVWLSSSSAARNLSAALFQDSTANALAAGSEFTDTTATLVPRMVKLKHTMAAGTTSSTTFRIRAGASNTGTTTFNGVNAARIFGAINKSSITITEYKA